VIHRLFEARVALLQHLPVDVDYVYARLAVSASFARVVEDAQCDVPRPARNVDATDVSLRSRTQMRNKGVLPEAVHAEGHGVVHEIIARRDRVEYAPYERLF
jgi:hypothetical protein